MAKVKPKAFFPNKYMAAISYKKVDVFEEMMKEYQPYFQTWEEAHDWQVMNALKAIKLAEKELAKVSMHFDRVKKMKEPNV